MNYFDLFGQPRRAALGRGQVRGGRRYLPVNILHPSWEPALDARLSGYAHDVGSMASASSYMSPRSEEYDPYPGKMDVPEPRYLPYHSESPTPIADDPLPPPRDFELEPEPVQARYLYLTDAMFEQAMREVRQEATAPGHPSDAVSFEPPTPLPPQDEQLEQLLGRLGPLAGLG